MTALILYRSYYGNTRAVAETIGKKLTDSGYTVLVQDVRQKLPDLSHVDVVFNGAPTRIRKANRRSVGVLKRLKSLGFTNKPVVIFDTCAVLPTKPEELEKAKSWIIPGAAGHMQSKAAELGLKVHPETLRCEVKEMKGPLADGVAQKIVSFVEDFIHRTTG